MFLSDHAYSNMRPHPNIFWTARFGVLANTLAICTRFNIDLFCLSISPLAWGHSGVTLRCLIPLLSKYSVKIFETNWGPLSLAMDKGSPYLENIFHLYFRRLCLQSSSLHKLHRICCSNQSLTKYNVLMVMA